MAAAAWERITRDPSIAGKGAPVDLGPPMLELHAAGASAFAGQLALRLRQQQLARELNPRLWSTPDGAPRCLEDVIEEAHALFESQDRLLAPLERATEQCVAGRRESERKAPLKRQLQRHFSALVFSLAPRDLDERLRAFLRASLRAASSSHHDEDDDDDDDDDDAAAAMEDDAEAAAAARARDDATWGRLRALGWLRLPLVKEAVTEVLYSEIEAHVHRRCAGEFETAALARVPLEGRGARAVARRGRGRRRRRRRRRRCGGGGGGRGRGGGGAGGAAGHMHDVARLRGQLDFAVHEVYCALRISELYDIIADFPDSYVAVREVRVALARTQQQRPLAVTLRETLRRRLLHPGANTTQIIDMCGAELARARPLVRHASVSSHTLSPAPAREPPFPRRAFLEKVHLDDQGAARDRPARRAARDGRAAGARVPAPARRHGALHRRRLTDENSGDLHDELHRENARPLDAGGDDSDDDDARGGPRAAWRRARATATSSARPRPRASAARRAAPTPAAARPTAPTARRSATSSRCSSRSTARRSCS